MTANKSSRASDKSSQERFPIPVFRFPLNPSVPFAPHRSHGGLFSKAPAALNSWFCASKPVRHPKRETGDGERKTGNEF